jgi:putative oxidoreductase
VQLRTIATWALRIAMAGLFALSATQKLINDPQYIAEFAKLGFGDWLRYVTALLELIGVVTVLYPRTTQIGVMLLLFVTGAAFIAQLTVLHVGWLHCAAIALALGALFLLNRTGPAPVPKATP